MDDKLKAELERRERYESRVALCLSVVIVVVVILCCAVMRHSEK